MQEWQNYFTGTVVRWNKSLWIVSEVHDKGLELIDFNNCNCTAFPTTTWPDSKRGVKSVEYVAGCVKDFILENTRKVFQLDS